MAAERPLVLYHGPGCADGFASAWVARRRFGDGADYLPVQYGQGPPDVKGREVFILDFSYKRDVLLRMAEGARLTVLDHHKTAEAGLCGLATDNPRCVFDMEKSGARLAWEFFFPEEDAPFLVDLVEDRDLWRWRVPFSRELNAWLATLQHDFVAWDQIARDLDRPFWLYSRVEGAPGSWGMHGLTEHAAEQGRAVLRYQERQVEAICACAREVELGGHRVLAANTSCLFSEVAGKLAEGRPFGAAWFVRSDGKRQWSLRSRDGGVDVSEVAKRRGGGGHHNAAGFEEDA